MLQLISGYMVFIIGFLLVASLLILCFKAYKKVPNDKMIVVYGGMGNKKKEGYTQRTCQGGGIFVIPFFQAYETLDLQPISMDVPLKGALTKDSIRINVPSRFTVGIKPDDRDTLNNAINRILQMNTNEIRQQSLDIIIGQLRDVVSRMDIVELVQDRNKFNKLINESVEVELNKIGLSIINVNIEDVTDDEGYIEARGRREMTSAIQKAEVDVSEQERIGAIGVADNRREKDISVSKYDSERAIGVSEAERDAQVRQSDIDAEKTARQNSAKAKVAESNAELATKEADSKRIGETSVAKADHDIYREQQIAEQARIERDTIPQAQVRREEIEIEAEADASRVRINAQGDADSIRLRADADAHKIKTQLEAQAEGIRSIVEACNGDPHAAIQMLLVDKAEEIMAIQADAIKHLKIDSVTLWGGQGSQGGGTGSVGDFVKDIFTMFPQVQDMLNTKNLSLPSSLVETLDVQAGNQSKEVAKAPKSTKKSENKSEE